MKTRLASIVCLALLSLAFSAEAKKKPAPTPDPAAEAPSARLSRFMKAHLDEVLAPIDKKGLRNAEAIVEFSESLAGQAAKLPPAQRPSYQTAEDVCQAMANAYAAREKSILSYKNARARDSFFTAGQKTQWEKTSSAYRQQIEQLSARQRETERHVNAAIAAAAAAAAAQQARETPPATAPLPPIVGTLPPPVVTVLGSSPATPSIP